MALVGYVSFAETVFDEARYSRIPRARLMRMLADTLVATIAAAVSASDSRN